MKFSRNSRSAIRTSVPTSNSALLTPLVFPISDLVSPPSVFCQSARCRYNLFRIRQEPFFQRRRVRHRRVESRDARDGPVEIFKGAFAYERGNFSGDATRTRV